MISRLNSIHRKWSAIAVLVMTVSLGCSVSSAPPKVSSASRELQEQFYVNSTEQMIKAKNFHEAMRFVAVIPPDSKYASKVPELQKQIEELISEYDKNLAERYSKQESVDISLTPELDPNSNGGLLISGRSQLPRYTRLNVSIWREDTPDVWKIFSEEESEIEIGSGFKADIAYPYSKLEKAAVEQNLTGNFEVRITGYFRKPTDQTESVLKQVGLKGEKISGAWVEQTESDGKYIRYRQRYRLNTHFNSPDCLHIKAEKF